jgi:hypothetical protein
MVTNTYINGQVLMEVIYYNASSGQYKVLFATTQISTSYSIVTNGNNYLAVYPTNDLSGNALYYSNDLKLDMKSAVPFIFNTFQGQGPEVFITEGIGLFYIN